MKFDERGPLKHIYRRINQIEEKLKSLRVASSPTVRVNRTSTGQILRVTPGSPGVAGDAGAAIQRFKVTSISDNWLVCRKVDSANAETSTDDFKVMRPVMLRKDKALPSGAVTASLSAPTSQARSFLVAGGNGQNYSMSQYLYPAYVAGDFIYGANRITGGTVDDGAGSQVDWIDLNIDARHWVFDLKVIDVCVGNVPKTALSVVSEPGA